MDTENFPAHYPVEQQASSIDDTPTNNMDMERLMGLTDQRLKKLQTLPAVSRSIIMRKTRVLREARKDSRTSGSRWRPRGRRRWTGTGR